MKKASVSKKGREKHKNKKVNKNKEKMILGAKKKKGSHNKDVPSKTFYLNEPCLTCGEKLARVSSTDRYLTSKEGRIRAFVEVYECRNEKCQLYKQKIKPPQLNTLIFPGLSYGIDILAEIAVLRFQENKTIDDIYEEITKNYPHLEITSRHLQNVTNKVMYALESSALNPDLIKERMLKKVQNRNKGKNKELKGLVLSIDGLQPERGNSILYIVREVQTGEVLLARFMEFSDEESIQKEIYEPLKKILEAIDLPVLGLVADKQLVLTTAFKKVFPQVPVQHCQSHFLKEIRKPIQEMSQKMAKDIKKN